MEQKTILRLSIGLVVLVVLVVEGGTLLGLLGQLVGGGETTPQPAPTTTAATTDTTTTATPATTDTQTAAAAVGPAGLERVESPGEERLPGPTG